jgi:hypothetical protein
MDVIFPHEGKRRGPWVGALPCPAVAATGTRFTDGYLMANGTQSRRRDGQDVFAASMHVAANARHYVSIDVPRAPTLYTYTSMWGLTL